MDEDFYQEACNYINRHKKMITLIAPTQLQIYGNQEQTMENEYLYYVQYLSFKRFLKLGEQNARKILSLDIAMLIQNKVILNDRELEHIYKYQKKVDKKEFWKRYNNHRKYLDITEVNNLQIC